MAGRKILLVGDNFGAGSSREHAPWALTAWGIRAILSTSFADIFRSNSLKNGVLPIVVDAATHARLFELLADDPDAAADGRPRRAGRPAAGRHDHRLRHRPVRQADDPGGHGRARLPPLEGCRAQRLGSGPPAADRLARRSGLSGDGARVTPDAGASSGCASGVTGASMAHTRAAQHRGREMLAVRLDGGPGAGGRDGRPGGRSGRVIGRFSRVWDWCLAAGRVAFDQSGRP